tara:strand:- start:185 stop:601 length:417 start_codon:yes stop_codon:yes gene_type:complete
MNKLESIKKHLEFNGYEITGDTDETGGFYAFHDKYGPLCIREIGINLGIRLDKYFPIEFQNCDYEQKFELLEMLNQMNANLFISTSYLYEKEGLGMSYAYMGEYEQKRFANVLEGFHGDTEKMYEYDLQKYWRKQIAN